MFSLRDAKNASVFKGLNLTNHIAAHLVIF